MAVLSQSAHSVHDEKGSLVDSCSPFKEGETPLT